MTSYKSGDIVVIPFPFVDKDVSKPRPALVLSSRGELLILAMITTASSWVMDDDYEISDLNSAGLPVPSYVRMKVFTLDTDIIKKKIGTLSNQDKQQIKSVFQDVFSDWIA
jgi:mRNA interferase MazF